MQTSTRNTGGAGSVRNELSSDAQQLGNAASNRLHSEIDARKGGVAEQARSVSSAIDRAAGEIDDAPQWIQSAFKQGATQVRRLADTLEHKDSREIMTDLRILARDNPGTFLAGCAAIGFAAARVFKAGADDESDSSESPESQARQSRFPPAQGQDPMLSSTGDTASRTPASVGEFA